MPNASFQIDEEKLEAFDRKIKRQQLNGDLPSDASRSDVLRDLIADYVDNGDAKKAAAQ